MARSRNIKPGFFKNYDLADLGPLAQILFAGLWCLADKEGLLEDKPRFIKAEVFPYYDCDVNGELTKLERLGFVSRYQVGEMRLLQVIGFKKHQSPHHTEKISVLPANNNQKATMSSASTITDKHRELTVSPLTMDGGNPPDSPIHRLSDSPISENPVPGGTGSVAPLAKPDKVEQPKTTVELAKAELWKAGKSLLLNAGMPMAQCGTFVGKLCKNYGDDIVVDAVRSAVVERPADPASWLKATCQRRMGQRKQAYIFDFAVAQKTSDAEAKRLLFGDDEGKTIDG